MVMSVWLVRDNMATKTTYGCGNKMVTTTTKTKSGATKTKTKIVNGVKPRKARKPK